MHWGCLKFVSRTDHDATFMRLEEGAMLNAQPKPGYDIQIESEN